MAIFLQVVSARLGVVTGKDLAHCCRDHLPGWTRWPNYLSCEIAIAACDLAEVLGSAVAIHLLFPRISLLTAVIITAFDVLLLLSLQRLGMRWIEAVIVVLIGTIGVCYYIQIFVLPQTKPNLIELASATVSPNLAVFFKNRDMVFIAIGIIGATVMPHNLYLHSALVQSRKLQADDASVRRAIKFNTLDSRYRALACVFCECRHPRAGWLGLFWQRQDDTARRRGGSVQRGCGLDSGGVSHAELR